MDRPARGGRDGRQPAGAALVADPVPVRRLTADADAVGLDRTLLGGGFSRRRNEQPRHPPGGGRAVGRWPAGGARPRAAGCRTRGPRRTPVLEGGLVVLRGHGPQRRRQRVRPDHPRRPRRHHVRPARAGQGRGTVRTRLPGLAAAPQRTGRLAGRPRGAWPAGSPRVDRGPDLRSHVRYCGRARPHSAAGAGAAPVDHRGDDRLRLRRSPHFGAGSVRLAVRPVLRHRGDRAGAGVPGRGAASAPPRRHVAVRSHVCVAVRLRGAAVRDVLGRRPVHAGDVLHAHGGAHAAVDAGADPAGAGRGGDAGTAGTAGCRARRTARAA